MLPRPKPTSNRRTADCRAADTTRAFTLLEILLALGLSVVLLAAIAASIDLYRRMTTAGQDELSEARLVRAVLRKMESDIRSVVPPLPQQSAAAAAASSSSGSSSSSSSSTSSSSSGQMVASPLDSVYSRNVFGLYGDARTLVLNTLIPHRLTPTQSGSTTPTQPLLSNVHGDLKIVAYFMTGAGTAAASVPTSGQSGTGGVVATSGLARLEGDRVAVSYAMEQSSMLTSSARILAPEVTAVNFRYFDGLTWQISWDGSGMQLLPNAIEIMISVRSAATVGSSVSPTNPASSVIRVYRHVVPISTAPPPQPTSSTSNGSAS
jgi:type II secretory pathway component PulJ